VISFASLTVPGSLSLPVMSGFIRVRVEGKSQLLHMLTFMVLNPWGINKAEQKNAWQLKGGETLAKFKFSTCSLK